MSPDVVIGVDEGFDEEQLEKAILRDDEGLNKSRSSVDVEGLNKSRSSVDVEGANKSRSSVDSNGTPDVKQNGLSDSAPQTPG